MHLVVRQAFREDFDAMMQLCRQPGDSQDVNRTEWDALWFSESTVGVVVEDLAREEERTTALMMGAYVTDTFLNTCLESPEPFILRRLAASPQEMLETRMFGPLNAGSGVNLLVAYMGWEGTNHVEFPAPSLRAIVVNAFLNRYGGNRLKWLIGEIEGPDLLDLAKRSGCELLNDYPDWAALHDMLESEERPYLLGISDNRALQVENQWVQRMFTYFPPRFHFTEPQRQILFLARDGYTDAEIARELGVSADAVKKRWAKIYDRVKEVFPALLSRSPHGGRGAEKRRTLLAHLRERPEELRPFERRKQERPPAV